MRALVFGQSLSLDPHRADPSPADGDTLIRVRQAGICATDLEIVKGYGGFAGVLGHEFVGQVLQSPDPALIGQRVVGEINLVCGRCDLCLSGLSAHCRNRTVMGIAGHDGCFADLLRLPHANLHVIPALIDDDAAVFVEPLAAAFQVAKQVKLDAKTWATVLGDGRLGLLVAQVLRNAGCPVRLIGKHAVNLAMCEKWQIRARALSDISPRHDQDVVVDCTGSPGGLDMALQMIRPRGTIVMKTTTAASKPIDLTSLVVDEVKIVGSRCGPFREALRALLEKQVDVVSLIHRRMRLEQGQSALVLAAQPGVLKVILTMDS